MITANEARQAFQKAIDAEIEKTEKEIKDAIRYHKLTITHSDSFEYWDDTLRDAFIAQLREAGFKVKKTTVGYGYPAQVISWDE